MPEKKPEPAKDEDDTAEAFEHLAAAKDEEDPKHYEEERRDAGIKLLTSVRNVLKQAGYDPTAKPPAGWEFQTARGGAIAFRSEPREIIVSVVTQTKSGEVEMTKLAPPAIEYEFRGKQWVGTAKDVHGKRQSAVVAVAERVVEGLKQLSSGSSGEKGAGS